MSIYNLIRYELGYTKLVSDIENLLGWDEVDFGKAYSELFYKHGDEHPLKDYFVKEEPFEFELMNNLEQAFSFIAITKLHENIVGERL